MKKGLLLLLAFLLLATLFACGSDQAPNGGDEISLTVFAAASLSEVLLEIAEYFTEKFPHVSIRFSFDSSGTLQRQIEEGAQADVFISADTREIEVLEMEHFLLENSRVDLLENQLVLVVPSHNPGNIESFTHMVAALLAEDILLAIGNMDVPAGRYAQEVLNYLGLDHRQLAQMGLITYGFNVREVAIQVREASAHAGMVYLTDALSFDLNIVDIATLEMTGPIIYPAAILRDSQHSDTAQLFLDFLGGEKAMGIFTAWGFHPFVK